MSITTHDAKAGERRIDHLLTHYGQTHGHHLNKAIHNFAVPLIMFSLIGLIYAAHPVAAYLLIGASLVYYFRLSRNCFIVMLAVSAIMLALVQAMGPLRLELSLGIFLVAWVYQFIGHAFEGKKPSFFEDLRYLWIGPLFVLSPVLGKFGLKW